MSRDDALDEPRDVTEPELDTGADVDDAPTDGTNRGADERVAEGVDHLQHAAREVIAAARAFLDVVEEVVADSGAVASLSEMVSTFGEAVSRAAGRVVPDSGDEEAGDDEAGAGPPGRARASRVEHIDLS